MKIANAVSNEHGTAKNGVKGDQTSREIRVQNWYLRDGGWDYYLEPKDSMIAHRAAKIGRMICENDSFGYDQVDRWSGLAAFPDGTGDFDCSSLAISCYILGGLDLPRKGYSGDIVERLMATGQFNIYTDDEHLKSDKLAVPGGIYVAPRKHVVICVGEADDSDFDTDINVLRKITALGSVRVRDIPKIGKTVRVLHKGDVESVVGVDDQTGWYRVKDGYVTNNTKYIK